MVRLTAWPTDHPTDAWRRSYHWPCPHNDCGRYGRYTRGRHGGIDFARSAGHRLVVAAHDGWVRRRDHGAAYGVQVSVDHAEGWGTFAAHLARLEVPAGAWVRAGTRLGVVGATGRTTGPHAHWEVHSRAGVWRSDVDPAPLLEDLYRRLSREEAIVAVVLYAARDSADAGLAHWVMAAVGASLVTTDEGVASGMIGDHLVIAVGGAAVRTLHPDLGDRGPGYHRDGNRAVAWGSDRFDTARILLDAAGRRWDA